MRGGDWTDWRPLMAPCESRCVLEWRCSTSKTQQETPSLYLIDGGMPVYGCRSLYDTPDNNPYLRPAIVSNSLSRSNDIQFLAAASTRLLIISAAPHLATTRSVQDQQDVCYINGSVNGPPGKNPIRRSGNVTVSTLGRGRYPVLPFHLWLRNWSPRGDQLILVFTSNTPSPYQGSPMKLYLRALFSRYAEDRRLICVPSPGVAPNVNRMPCAFHDLCWLI